MRFFRFFRFFRPVDIIAAGEGHRGGAPARRQHVAFALKRGLSQRRACALLSISSRSTLHYESRMDAHDGPLIVAMSGLTTQYPRYWSHHSTGVVSTNGLCPAA